MSTTDRIIHLMVGNGQRTVCGLSAREAAETYAPDAPVCPICGPRSAPNEIVQRGGVTQAAETSVSQWAMWQSSDGLASVRVYGTSHRDSRGAPGWSYYISCPTDKPNVSIGQTFADPSELVYGWETSPHDVLGTLSSFIGAWAEAQGYPESDNLALFPMSIVGICDYADELSADTDGELEEVN